jgi:hypothetical protein
MFETDGLEKVCPHYVHCITEISIVYFSSRIKLDKNAPE